METLHMGRKYTKFNTRLTELSKLSLSKHDKAATLAKNLFKTVVFVRFWIGNETFISL